MKYDITILTDRRYVKPTVINDYIENVLTEDGLVKKSLEKLGLTVQRISWDDPQFDWSQTEYVLFRTTWDYFDRFDEFFGWLNEVNLRTKLINSYELINWNIDKSYLFDLKSNGIPIPPSIYIKKGDQRTIRSIMQEYNWTKLIVKPAIAGAARETYLVDSSNIDSLESRFNTLIDQENMIIQEFQEQITDKGEISLMLFGDQFSHAVLKKAKKGDFRVQDDFGGTVHHYSPSSEEIDMAKMAFKACISTPVYGRVDMMWDNANNLCISELELIEPELWFRMHPTAADTLANSIIKQIRK